MACCTNTYDLGCHSQCDLLGLTDLQWPSSGDFCFYFSFAGNTYTWTTEDQVSGENVQLSMQYLNEDGETTFYIKDSNGNILTFDIDGTEYDCFKIQAIPAGCGTTDFTTDPVTCSTQIGVEGQLAVWGYALQEWLRLNPGTAGQVLTIVGGVPAWADAGGGGGGGTWGTITGTLSNQTDLQTALDAKVPTTRAINTTAPLAGGGNLSADRTLTLTLGNLLQVVSNALALGGVASTDADLEMGDNQFKVGKEDVNMVSKLETHLHLGEYFNGSFAKNKGTNIQASARTYYVVADGKVYIDLLDTDLNALEQLGFIIGDNNIRGYSRTGSVWTFVDSNGNPFLIYDEADGGFILGHDTADRPGVGTIIRNTPVLLDLAGGGNQMVVVDNNGIVSAQAIPSGGSGKCVYVNSFSTLTSVVGLGYSFATPIYIASLTIPANTLQAGDIIQVLATGRRSGTGNSAQIIDLANNVSRGAATEFYGSHGALNTNMGVNYQTYLYASGDFWDPIGVASSSAIGGDAYANGASNGGFTQAAAGSGQIDYASPLYLHCWGIAANTCTLTLLEMSVKVYRP